MQLNVWHSKEEPETRQNMPCRAFRKSLQLAIGRKENYIMLFHEYQLKGSCLWNYAYIVFGIGLARKWSFGRHHGWYDGPNCSLHLGWLRFDWSGNPWTGRCAKCEPKY